MKTADVVLREFMTFSSFATAEVRVNCIVISRMPRLVVGKQGWYSHQDSFSANHRCFTSFMSSDQDYSSNAAQLD